MTGIAIYLIAAGGHGKVVLDALLQNGENVVGIIDPALATDEMVFGVRVLGGDEVLERVNPVGVRLALGVGALPRNANRRQLFQTLKLKGFSFVTVLHPSAVVGRAAELSEGCQIMAGAVLQNGVYVGRNTVVNTRASVDHGCRLRDHVFVAPGAVLCGEVQVGEGAYVGAGATILPGIEVGPHATVGAGAIVIRPVSAGVTVVGNPAVRLEENSA